MDYEESLNLGKLQKIVFISKDADKLLIGMGKWLKHNQKHYPNGINKIEAKYITEDNLNEWVGEITFNGERK